MLRTLVDAPQETLLCNMFLSEKIVVKIGEFGLACAFKG